jgi:hypothetical protein
MAWDRPVSWGAVFLSYIGIIGVAAYAGVTLQLEQDHRQSQICQIIKNVHMNAEDRVGVDKRRVEGITAYLRDREVPRDALYNRIRETLPRAREDYAASREAAIGTKPPSSCRA